MVKKEIGGRTYYCWTDEEAQARRSFEETISIEGVADHLMDSLVRAIAKANAERQKAWEQIKAVAGIPDDDKQKIMFYDWVIGGFRLRD